MDTHSDQVALGPGLIEDSADEQERGGIPWARIWERWLEPVFLVVIFLVLFDVAARLQIIGTENSPLPRVTQISSAMWDDVFHGTVMEATWITVRTCIIATAIAFVVAVPLGLLIGSSQLAYRISHLPMEALRTIPSLAAIPFLVLVYGVGTKLIIILVLFNGIWPLLLNTAAGVQDVEPVARDTGRVYGLRRTRQFRQIVIPSAMPYIATGLRISATYALLLAIGASLFAGGEGLGNEISTAQQQGQLPLVFARALIASFLGLIVYYLLTMMERRVLAWHPSYRKTT